MSMLLSKFIEKTLSEIEKTNASEIKYEINLGIYNDKLIIFDSREEGNFQKIKFSIKKVNKK